MGALDYLTSMAVSLTVSGNTGISPFLTLLLLGIIEKSDPSLLNMDGWIEKVLASWASLVILSILTILEFVGKCIPVVDEIIDSVEVFAVPVLSIFSSLGTLGLLDLAAGSTTGDGRQLASVGGTFLTIIKVVVVIVGIGLALAIHLFKMLIRLVALGCAAGCCQPCITIMEVMAVLTSVLFAVFVREIALVTCIIVFVAAGWAIKRKFFDKKNENENRGAGTLPASVPAPVSAPAPARAPPPTTPATTTGNNRNDEESPTTPGPVAIQPTAPLEKNSSSLPRSNDDIPPAINPDYVTILSQEDGSPDKETMAVEATAVEVKAEQTH